MSPPSFITHSKILCLVLAVAVSLSGCFDDKKAQAEQLAQMQAKIEEQERQNSLMQAQMQQEAERVRHEEELRKAKEEAKQEIEAELKSKLTKEQPTPPKSADTTTSKNATSDDKKSNKPTGNDTKPATKAPTLQEKLVRYPATVITTSGYGEVSLRGEPSAKGIQISTVPDGYEVQVIAETNRCETIGKVQGCWFKVDAYGSKGYMFGGYLQREILSQAEKDYLFYQNSEYGDIIDDYGYVINGH